MVEILADEFFRADDTLTARFVYIVCILTRSVAFLAKMRTFLEKCWYNSALFIDFFRTSCGVCVTPSTYIDIWEIGISGAFCQLQQCHYCSELHTEMLWYKRYKIFRTNMVPPFVCERRGRGSGHSRGDLKVLFQLVKFVIYEVYLFVERKTPPRGVKEGTRRRAWEVWRHLTGSPLGDALAFPATVRRITNALLSDRVPGRCDVT